MSNYDDIINLPHHRSEKHARLSMQSRAAQFGAFAALEGHGDVIEENARYTDSRIITAEDAADEIATRLKALSGELDKRPAAVIEYFVADDKKSGGKYVKAEGRIKNIDEYKSVIVMEDETEIDIDSIISVD